MPARTAYIPLIVPERALLAANSLSQTGLIIAGVAGAAFAGWVIASFGTYWPAFVADALTFWISALLISRVVTPSGGAGEGRSTAGAVVGEMKEGFRVLISSRVLIGVLASMAVTMLGLGMVRILLVPLVVNDLGVSEAWFAAIQFAQSASMVMSGALLAVLAARFRATRIVIVALVCTGVAVALVSQVSNLAGLIVILFGIGWFMTPLQSSLMTLLQSNVADALRGRAGSALNMSSQTANVVSMAGAGMLADAVGARNVFLLGGAITVLAGAIAAVIFRGQPDRPPAEQIGPDAAASPTLRGGA
jgi:predicted MFS family arabinose efflux permease